MSETTSVDDEGDDVLVGEGIGGGALADGTLLGDGAAAAAEAGAAEDDRRILRRVERQLDVVVWAIARRPGAPIRRA